MYSLVALIYVSHRETCTVFGVNCSRTDRETACQISNTEKMADKEKDQEKANKDHRSDEMNPNNPACQARMDHQANQGNRDSEASQAVRDNRANQLNPKHHEYKGGRQDDQDDETVPKTEAQ